MRAHLPVLVAACALAAATLASAAPVSLSMLDGPPDATVDLRTTQGVRLVKGEWRYSDAQVVEVEHHSPGPDLKPSGPPNRTHDIAPHAGAADFDDSGWQMLDPASLEGRRGTGRLSFNWYRIKLTIPEKVGSLDTTGSTAVFEIVLDDYAEVWVDGKLPQVLGQTGGPVIKGYNAPNRVVVGRDLKPGQQDTARGVRRQRRAFQPARQLHLGALRRPGLLCAPARQGRARGARRGQEGGPGAGRDRAARCKA